MPPHELVVGGELVVVASAPASVGAICSCGWGWPRVSLMTAPDAASDMMADIAEHVRRRHTEAPVFDIILSVHPREA